MDSRHAPSPFSFLAALSAERALDRAVIGQTRAKELQICGHMTLAAKVATLYAFSGNGKSSMIQAGLIPFFNDLGYAVFKTRPRPPYALTDPTDAFKEGCLRENWIPATSASDADVLGEARQELDAQLDADLPAVRRLIERLDAQQIRLSATPENRGADLTAYLRRCREGTISEFLGEAQKFLGNVPMIVICDQFEEIFVHYYNTPGLERFIDGLKQACDNPALRVHFLFSMREDWVGSMIIFRDAIPDIFNCTYRLDPIRRSKAGPALSLPLEAAGVSLEPTVAHRILDDLADFYRRQQRLDDAAVHLTPSRPDDPYIELPALQTIADRLWHTRTLRSTAFSLDHYLSLASKAEVAASGSPAAACLDGYLKDTLRGINDEAERPDQTLNELRLDVLYLLTDKVAHRKALGEREILAELKMVRANFTGQEPVDRAMLGRALRPLQNSRLVREDGGTSVDPRYELAHDFVVRSVVRAWKALDRRRTQDAAVRAEQQKQDSSRLLALLKSERLGARSILVLCAGLMALTFALSADVHSGFRGPGGPFFYQKLYYDNSIIDRYLFLGYCGAFSALLGLSLALSVRTGLAIAAIALCLFYSAYFGPLRWPETSMVLTHWATIFLCMVPALVVDLSNALGITERRRTNWMKSAARAIDYALILLSATSTFVVMFDPSIFDEGLWFPAFGPALAAVVVVQLSAIARGRRTIGEWWVRDESSEISRAPGRRIAALAALFIVAVLNWAILIAGIETYPSYVFWAPYGAPVFFVLHLGALIVLHQLVDRRTTSARALDDPTAQPYEGPASVAADSAQTV